MKSAYMTTKPHSQQNHRSEVYYGLFVLGVILRFSPLLNPVHEFMHVLAVAIDGADLVSVEWSKVTWRNAATQFPLWGAYWMELFFYGICAIGWKKGFGLGVMFVVYVDGLASWDFAQYGKPVNYVLYAILGAWFFYQVLKRQEVSGEKSKK